MSYAGKILKVDLNTKTIKSIELDPRLCKRYLGGEGFGIKILYDVSEKDVHPLSSKNPFILMCGAFAGLPIPASLYGVFAKSPQTNFLGEAFAKGMFAPELKYAGYDGIVIFGRAKHPSYIYIEDEEISLFSASDLWGKDTLTTIGELMKRHKGAQVLCIGPAGENCVSFACIENDFGRHAGRTGLGAVLGSKNIKAIVVRGSKSLKVYDENKFLEELEYIWKEEFSEKTEKYRVYGTPGGVTGINKARALPTRNWHGDHVDFVEQISGERMKEELVVKELACLGCFVACRKISQVDGDKFVEGPEYETIYSFGADCLIPDLKKIAELHLFADLLGIDAISAGAISAFAIDLFERGIIKKEELGFELRYGDVEAIKKFLRLVAYREGIGDIFARGIKFAAEKFKAREIAIHVKGLEPPGYEARTLESMAISYAVSRRGACHLRAGAYEIDLRGGKLSLEEKVREIVHKENLYVLYDSFGICKFMRRFVDENYLAKLCRIILGWRVYPNQLLEKGAQIVTLARKYNVREGLTMKDDMLPDRFFEEEVNGKKLDKKVFLEALKLYYKLRGWDERGIPR